MLIQTILDERFGDHPRHACDVFVPEGTRLPLVLAVHGGWWTAGRREDLRPFALRLASLGVPVALLGHRIIDDGAKHGLDLLDDLATAASRAIEVAGTLGCNEGVAVFGSGSGSLLALLLVERLARDRALVRAGILAGVTASAEHSDLAGPLAKLGDRFCGSHRGVLNPVRIAPAQQPPLLLIHGEADHDVPMKSVQRILNRQLDAGQDAHLVLVPEAGHEPIAGDAGERSVAAQVRDFLATHAAPLGDLELFTGLAGQAAP